MPLVFPVEIAFVAMVAAFGAFLLLRTETMWLRPLVQALQHPHGSWWKRVVLKPLAVVATATLFVEKHVRLALSHFASGSLHMLTRWFNGLAASVHHFVKEVGDLAPDWADSFAWFRHRTLPREITKKTAPIKLAAAHAGALAGRSISVGRANRVRFGKAIDRLRREYKLLAGLLLGADLFVFGRHAHTHHQHHVQTIPGLQAGARATGREVGRLGKVQARHRSQIKRLLLLLTVTGFGALLWRVLLRWKLGWLRCGKWRLLGPAVCNMRADAFQFLLALLLGAFALSDLRRTARIAEDALDYVTGVVWDAAQLGDRPSGRFTID